MNDSSKKTENKTVGVFANTIVPTPPAFGTDKKWATRILEWGKRHPTKPDETINYETTIPRGCLVPERYYVAYWEARARMVQALDEYRVAEISPPFVYFLYDENDTRSGYGEFDAADGPDDMAWINCWFLNLHGWRAVLLTVELQSLDRDV